MSEDPILKSVEIKDATLVVKTGSEGSEAMVQLEPVRVRLIANVELVHDTTKFDTVRVNIGITDLSQRPMFVHRTVKKRFLGEVRDKEALKQFRADFEKLDVPVLEY